MPGRAVRSYPAMLSTEADALAWARAGGPDGAVVAAGFQAAPRGRAGTPWTLDHERDLCFSMVLRPELPAEREGWLYAVTASALADTVSEGAAIEWPDEVRHESERRGAVGVQSGLGPGGVEWAVATLSLLDCPRPRAEVIARLAEATAAGLARPPDAVLAGYRPRCSTLGRSVRVRVTGVGADQGTFTGRAADVLADGSLAIETAEGRRVAVRPQHLWSLDDAPA